MKVTVKDLDVSTETFEKVYVQGRLMGVEFRGCHLSDTDYALMKKHYEEIDGLFFVETENLEYGD